MTQVYIGSYTMMTYLNRTDFSIVACGTFVRIYECHRGSGGLVERGVNVNAYLSVCSKSVSRLSRSILDRRNYRTNK